MRTCIWVFILFEIIFPLTLKSQNTDSIKLSLEKETNDTIRIKAYIKIVKLFNSREPVKALPFALSLVKLAEKVNIEKFMTSSYNQLGITYLFLGNTNKSAELFLKVLHINEKNNDSLSISRSLNNIGLAYHNQKAYTKALEYFGRSLEIKKKLEDYPTLWTTYLNIGLSYSALEEYQKTLQNYYWGLHAWEMLKEEKNENYASIMSELGIIYEITDSLNSAERILIEANTYFEKSKTKFRVANTLLYLAKVKRKKGNLIAAQDYINKSIQLINESGAYTVLPDCYSELSLIEESKGNIKKAFDYYRKEQVLRDSVNKENNLKEMNQMLEMYNIEQQEAETVVLKKEIELNSVKLDRNKLVSTGAIILLIFVLSFLVFTLINLNRRKIANNKLTAQQKIISNANEELQKQKAELQLLTNELKRLNTDKDRFMAILAHDLKSPFNTLLGFSGALTEDIRQLDIDEIEDFANQINTTARKTYDLLEDILDWARVQSGKIPFNPVKLNFADICKNTVEILTDNAYKKSITINCLASAEIYVFADPDMLKTVLRNLISNAIKFTNSGGAINIAAEQSESYTTITISDNGVGMSSVDSAKLFDMSLINTTIGTANEKGTGLGLLLCKEFVEKHSGKIWVVSEPGNGSAFNFTLPAE